MHASTAPLACRQVLPATRAMHTGTHARPHVRMHTGVSCSLSSRLFASASPSLSSRSMRPTSARRRCGTPLPSASRPPSSSRLRALTNPSLSSPSGAQPRAVRSLLQRGCPPRRASSAVLTPLSASFAALRVCCRPRRHLGLYLLHFRKYSRKTSRGYLLYV